MTIKFYSTGIGNNTGAGYFAISEINYGTGGLSAFRQIPRNVIFQIGANQYDTGCIISDSGGKARIITQSATKRVHKIISDFFLLPIPSVILGVGNSPIPAISDNHYTISSINHNANIVLTEQTITFEIESITLSGRNYPFSDNERLTLNLNEREEIIQALLLLEQIEDLPENFNLEDRILAIRDPGGFNTNQSSELLVQLKQDIHDAIPGYNQNRDPIQFLSEFTNLQDDDWVIDGITQEETIATNMEEAEQSRLERFRRLQEALIAGNVTDEVVMGIRRREQNDLRRAILGTRTENPLVVCSMCHRSLPNHGNFIICAHIKRRVDATEEERWDHHIVAPMCTFGCDSLFESGVIIVDEQGIIQTNLHALITSQDVLDRAEELVGQECTYFCPENEEYFAHHRARVGYLT